MSRSRCSHLLRLSREPTADIRWFYLWAALCLLYFVLWRRGLCLLALFLWLWFVLALLGRFHRLLFGLSLFVCFCGRLFGRWRFWLLWGGVLVGSARRARRNLRLVLRLCFVCLRRLLRAWFVNLLWLAGILRRDSWLRLLRLGRGGGGFCLSRPLRGEIGLLRCLFRARLGVLHPRLRCWLGGSGTCRCGIAGGLRRSCAKACTTPRSLDRFVWFTLWLLFLCTRLWLLLGLGVWRAVRFLRLSSRSLAIGRFARRRFGCGRLLCGLSLLRFRRIILVGACFHGAWARVFLLRRLGGGLWTSALGGSRLRPRSRCRLGRRRLGGGCLLYSVFRLDILARASLWVALRRGGLRTSSRICAVGFLGVGILRSWGLSRTSRASFGLYWLIDRRAWFI